MLVGSLLLLLSSVLEQVVSLRPKTLEPVSTEMEEKEESYAGKIVHINLEIKQGVLFDFAVSIFAIKLATK